MKAQSIRRRIRVIELSFYKVPFFIGYIIPIAIIMYIIVSNPAYVGDIFSLGNFGYPALGLRAPAALWIPVGLFSVFYSTVWMGGFRCVKTNTNLKSGITETIIQFGLYIAFSLVLGIIFAVVYFFIWRYLDSLLVGSLVSRQEYDVVSVTLGMIFVWLMGVTETYSFGMVIPFEHGSAKKFNEMKLMHGKGIKINQKAERLLDKNEKTQALEKFESARKKLEKAKNISREIGYEGDLLQKDHESVLKSINKLASKSVKEDMNKIECDINNANEYISNGNYNQSTELLSEIHNSIEDLKEKINERELDKLYEDIDSIEKEYKNVKTKNDRQQARSDSSETISNIESVVRNAKELVETGDIQPAQNKVESIEEDITAEMETTNEHGLDDLNDDLTQLDQRREDLLDEISEIRQEQRRQDLEEDIVVIHSEVDEIEALVEAESIDEAQARAEEIKSDIESVEYTIDEYESGAFEHLRNNLTQLKQQREDLLDEISEIRQEQRRQDLEDELDTLRSKLDDIDALTEEGSYDEAQTRIDAIASKIGSAKRKVRRNEFDDLQGEAEALEEQHQTISEKVPVRLKADTIPDAIPEAPNVSVNYNDLTDKEPIGGGGNADVTMATLPTTAGDVTVAIKEPRMAGTLQMDAVDQMLEEAETWDKLDDHDHIVSVLDYGDAPIPWIAMEYMDGGHLGSKSGVLDMAQALWTAIAITKGVRHAHRRGVAHLDLKPENVLFRSVEDGWDVPKVADWGLSKHLLEHSKSVEGLSPRYAAPEQFDDGYGPADDITDIYQLGAVFYELFTGCPPFEGKPAKTMNKVLHEEPTAPSEIADVPDELDEILLTALAKEKHDRYDGILYLRDELQELFDNQ